MLIVMCKKHVKLKFYRQSIIIMMDTNHRCDLLYQINVTGSFKHCLTNAGLFSIEMTALQCLCCYKKYIK